MTKYTKIPIRAYYQLLKCYLRPYPAWVTGLTTAVLLSIAGQLVAPQIMRYFLDAATSGADDALLLRAAVFYILTAVIQQFFSILSTYYGENLGWTATNNLRRDLLEHCLHLDLSFHKKHTPGEMIERIGEDVNSLANFFSQFVIRVFGNGLVIIGVLVLLYIENVWVGFTLTLFVILTMSVIKHFRDISIPYQRAARQASAELSGYVEERLNGTEDIRANNAIAHTLRGLFMYMRNRNDLMLVANLRGTRVRMAAIGLHYFGISLALSAGIIMFVHGLTSVGTICLFVIYTDLIYRPLMQITRQIEDFQQASAGIQRIQEILDLQSDIKDGNEILPEGPLSICWDKVCFAYDADDDKVLRDISFSLKAGETMGLLGRTGSGKTTVTRLLTRLYDYSSGCISYNNLDIKNTRLNDVRSRIGLVTQDVQLFYASVRDNITFFNPDVPDDLILNVLNELGLSSWLKALPRGLDTVLTGSQGLSAGEAQLLALSRVFLRNPGVIIMDEASSRLDPATEHLMEQAVNKLLQGRTGIIVAHRLSTIMKVDKILILENGQIKEYGDRTALMANPNSVFSNLLKTGLEEVLS